MEKVYQKNERKMPKIYKIVKEIYLSSYDKTATLGSVERLDLKTLASIEDSTGELVVTKTFVKEVEKKEIPEAVKERFGV